MINSFTLVGRITMLGITRQKRADKPASAVLQVQSGQKHEPTSGASAPVIVAVRIPSGTSVVPADRLRQGQGVQITGRILGVCKTLGDGDFTIELMAERIDIEGGQPPARG